ncbi:MAG: Gfo/Idh/MocA family oxidoreductase [Thermoguttaceae bacterium]|jgi:predicted dehydrogenase|nr:Gfo/Idh/MocA family oxidoreductase [Thermoguttaceae bacterium]
MSEFQKTTNRRTFLKGSTAAAAGAALVGNLSISRMAHAQGSDQIKAVLVGCGGRGNGAMNDSLTADPAVRCIAVADAFENRARGTADRLRNSDFKDRVDLPDERVFVGLDAFEKAIGVGADLMITATPPGFRPLVYSTAIKAGLNVFMEKPCCVDAPGFNILQEANKMADEKKLKVGVGFQRRHTPSYVETVQRIHDGAIGKLMLLRAYWNGSGIWNRGREEGMTEMQYQVHNWYHFCWLSGDNICEQHIHNLDVCNWAILANCGGDPKAAHPVEANGMGACTLRYKGDKKGTGQIFDTHFVEFTYADGTKMYSQCRHMPNTWTNVGEGVHGTLGTANPAGSIEGENAWRHSGERVNAMVQEHKDLIAAIRNGTPYNEGWHGAASSMTAVLGRMATYSGKIVKWDEAVAKGTSEFPSQLAWDAPAPVVPDENGDYPIPIPGVYEAY